MPTDPTTFLFEAGTGSRYGHVGVVVVPPDGKPIVYEETPPFARKTALDDFLMRATKTKAKKPEATVLAPTVPLTADEVTKLVTVLDGFVAAGTPYNFTMLTTPMAMNCSEFVSRAFADIGRSGVGIPEKASDQDLGGYKGNLLLMWKQFGGDDIPPDAPVLSPMSIVSSPALTPVVAMLPVGRVMSEREVLDAWKKANGFKLLETVVNPAKLQKLVSDLDASASSEPYRAYPATFRQNAAAK